MVGVNETINFKKMEFDEELQNFYNYANEKFFGYKLPYVRVGWYDWKKPDKLCYGVTLSVEGAAFCEYIGINPHFKEWTKVVNTIILHEMCHVKFNNRCGHGPKFKKEKRRLILAGAFDPYL